MTIGINERYPAAKAKGELRNRMRREQEKLLINKEFPKPPITINGKEFTQEDFETLNETIRKILRKQIEEHNAKK